MRTAWISVQNLRETKPNILLCLRRLSKDYIKHISHPRPSLIANIRLAKTPLTARSSPNRLEKTRPRYKWWKQSFIGAMSIYLRLIPIMELSSEICVLHTHQLFDIRSGGLTDLNFATLRQFANRTGIIPPPGIKIFILLIALTENSGFFISTVAVWCAPRILAVSIRLLTRSCSRIALWKRIGTYAPLDEYSKYFWQSYVHLRGILVSHSNVGRNSGLHGFPGRM